MDEVAAAGVDADAGALFDVFGDLDDEAGFEFGGFGAGGDGGAAHGRGGFGDFEVDGVRKLDAEDFVALDEGLDAFESVGEIGDGVLDFVGVELDLGVVVEVHEDEVVALAVGEGDGAGVEFGVLQGVVALEGLVEFGAGADVAEPDFVEGGGAAGGRGLDADLLDDVGVAVDLDDGVLFEVAGFDHGRTFRGWGWNGRKI